MEGRPLDEHELITRSRDGDRDAFGQLVQLHQQTALRVAYLVLHDAAEAEDVTQDAFVKAYRALSQFREESPFRPWLLKIVRNEALNRVRSTKRRKSLTLRLATDPVSGDAAPSPETVAITRDRNSRLLAAVNRLPRRHREVVTHRYLLGMSEQETAAILGVPRGTVKSRTARAIDKLEAALRPIEDGLR